VVLAAVILGYNAMQFTENHLATSYCYMLLSCLPSSLTLKTQATFFSKTSVDFQWTTQCYIPEDRTLQFLDPSHFWDGGEGIK
jgi:hypothetical protein